MPVPPENVVNCAAPYLRCAVTFYRDEKERQAAITEGLTDIAIGEPGNWVCHLNWAASQITPDGCWWHDEFLVLALALKNLVGLSGDVY